MSRILVTGATGFVGRQLCDSLVSMGHDVIGTTRASEEIVTGGSCEFRTITDIADDVDWRPILSGVDSVVHLAARVHVMRDADPDPLAAFRRVNVLGTEQLLRHEGMQNVSRVIYMSTVKVHGDATSGKPFTSNDVLAPTDPYARSKCEAEYLVQRIGAEVGFETTIIRPPLVYGAGVGGNFVRLIKMIDKGFLLPVELIENTRSLVGVDNLCDLIRECLTNPLAAGKQFLVSDDSDVSTPDLVRLIASIMSRPARLVPVPAAVLRLAGRLVGRSAEVSRLLGSLQVDIEETTRTLNWRPPVSLADGIRSTVTWYKEEAARG